MNFAMPASFPEADFLAFGRAASRFFPELLSDECLNDPLETRQHFDRARLAVRYRYRLCTDCDAEFRSLLASPSESWQAGWGDEELTYRLERCVYVFFVSALSVFESFGFCLYFLGGALRPREFPHLATPRNITLAATSKAFAGAFPNARITGELAALLKKPEFTRIESFRNLLAHRVSGRRTVREWSNSKTQGREDGRHIPSSPEELEFSDDMLQRLVGEVAEMLAALTVAAREFAENQDITAGSG